MARTEGKSDRRREMADLLVLPRSAKSVQNGAGCRKKNWNILGLPKRKEWPQCHRESSWQVRLSCPCQKEKEQSHLSRVPDDEGERVKVGNSRTLARKRGIRVRAWSGKGGLHSE